MNIAAAELESLTRAYGQEIFARLNREGAVVFTPAWIDERLMECNNALLGLVRGEERQCDESARKRNPTTDGSHGCGQRGRQPSHQDRRYWQRTHHQRARQLARSTVELGPSERGLGAVLADESEHLLLGLLRESECLAAVAVRNRVEAPACGPPPFTPFRPDSTRR